MRVKPTQPPTAPNVRADAIVRLPMTTPMYPDSCPCGRAPRINGLCHEHAGAVAFWLPITADGTVLPAVDWRWAHEQPCPLGQAWCIDSGASHAWACPHREHCATPVEAPSPQEDREAVVGDLLILTLRGEVDIAVTDPLRAAWYRAAEQAEHEMIDIDLGEVTFMDAHALGLLVGMLTRQEGHGGQLRLRRTPAHVTRLLQLTRLQGIFPVVDDLPDAVILQPRPR